MSRNTEDIKAGDLEMQDASQSVMTLDGELIAINGKLLAANHDLLVSGGKAGSITSIATVCSCTCYPRSHRTPDRGDRYYLVSTQYNFVKI